MSSSSSSSAAQASTPGTATATTEGSAADTETLQQRFARSCVSILLIGDAKTGKTSWLDAIVRGGAQRIDLSTQDGGRGIILPRTTRGSISVLIREVSVPDDAVLTLPIGAVTEADGIIIMFDLTKKSSFDTAAKWRNIIAALKPNKKVVVCGTMLDIATGRARAVSPTDIATIIRKTSAPDTYCEISAIEKINNFEPLLCMLGRVKGVPHLTVGTEHMHYIDTLDSKAAANYIASL